MLNAAGLKKAIRAGKRRAADSLWARSAHYDRRQDSVMIEISSGLMIGLPRSRIAEFAQIDPNNMDLTLSPAGDVLHLERFGIHVSIEGLIRDIFLSQIPAGVLSSALRSRSAHTGRRHGGVHRRR
jgi:hypothetical protein